jgi:XRE family transcriptional regulator, regulator of sulfur utilization
MQKPRATTVRRATTTPRRADPAAEPPRVGAALAALRRARGLSLDALSLQAGVSKSMLSQIERGQANPTVAVVWRLASALGVALADLLGEPGPAAPLVSTVPAHATPLLASPDRKCSLRILGPIELAGRFEWYQLAIEPGGTLDSEAHEPGSREHLSVTQGALEVRAGAEHARVRHGETARYAVDVPHRIHNPGKTAAQALLVVIHPA